jgi:hypothetical protein
MKKLGLGLYAALTAALLAWGFYQAIYVAPDEQTMHEVQRIFYYHVPSAMTAFLFFAISLAGSIGFLALRRDHPQRAQVADAWAVAGAEVGVVFCTVVLITGPMWGRRAWGIWWTWDARLTTTLVLWLLYVSYLLLRRFAAGPQMQTLAAVLGVCRPGRAHRLYVHPLVAHPAPRPGLRRRPGFGHQGPRHAARLRLEYRGLAGLGAAHSRSALPPRTPAPATDRPPGAGGPGGDLAGPIPLE